MKRSRAFLLTMILWQTLASPSAAQPQAQQTLEGHTAAVFSVAFSPDGATLASASSDKSICLWDLKTGKNTATLTGHTGAVYSVVFSPDGNTLASGSHDKTICLWDIKTGKSTATFRGPTDRVHRVTFSADGKTLASWSRDQSIRMWDVKTGTNTTSFPGQIWSFYPIVYSPDGRTHTWGNNTKTIPIRDSASDKIIATLEGHSAVVWGLAISPDSQTLASASADKTIKLWSLKRFPLLASVEANKAIEEGLKAAGVTAAEARDNTDKRKLLVAELYRRYLIVPNPELIKCMHFSQAVWDVLTGAKKHKLASGQAGGHEDTMLTELIVEASRANKPKVLDRAGMDELQKKKWTILYRGVGEKQFTEQFRSGPFYSGSGLYGNGTYAQKVMKPGAAGEQAAKADATEYGKHVIRIAMPPTATVVEHDKLKEEASAFQQYLDNECTSGKITREECDKLQAIAEDLGRFAVLRGYDGIHATDDGYFVLLNRSILAVEDKDQ